MELRGGRGAGGWTQLHQRGPEGLLLAPPLCAGLPLFPPPLFCRVVLFSFVMSSLPFLTGLLHTELFHPLTELFEHLTLFQGAQRGQLRGGGGLILKVCGNQSFTFILQVYFQYMVLLLRGSPGGALPPLILSEQPLPLLSSPITPSAVRPSSVLWTEGSSCGASISSSLITASVGAARRPLSPSAVLSGGPVRHQAAALDGEVRVGIVHLQDGLIHTGEVAAAGLGLRLELQPVV
ncbi:hypothetical protein F7725_024464 [Dissostichus mawsoni]|uniref:Uncharacterized protein n=1 Tax=Dissostichus mawsoni TaxID=36200 RepID=A0A7J5Y0D2_DISMA|nr:hypothetical protein F7725_024464 [Dissostichus mawsoni]